MDKFEIKILSQHWRLDNDPDDKEDMCSHGKIYLKIEDGVFSDESEEDLWSISVTGLMLLRTLNGDHTFYDDWKVIDEGSAYLFFPGNEGIDFEVRHRKSKVFIKISRMFLKNSSPDDLREDLEFEVDRKEYVKQIINYCKDVKEFFKGRDAIIKKNYKGDDSNLGEWDSALREWNDFWEEFDKLFDKYSKEAKNY